MSTHYFVGFGSRVVLSFCRFVSFIYYLIWSIYHLLLLIWYVILFSVYVVWLALSSIGSKGHKTILLALFIVLLCQVIILACQLSILLALSFMLLCPLIILLTWCVVLSCYQIIMLCSYVILFGDFFIQLRLYSMTSCYTCAPLAPLIVCACQTINLLSFFFVM